MDRVFLTGDCHGIYSRFNLKNFPEQRELTKDDYVIILGDFGLWHKNKEEDWWLDWLDAKPYTTLFLDGNHENFDRIYSDEFETVDFKGGKAQAIRPSVLHLCRGNIYHIGDRGYFVFGGAQSHDIEDGILEPSKYTDARELQKDFRHRAYTLKQRIRINHISWWKEELPSREEMRFGLETLEQANFQVDYVLTHSLPSEFVEKFDKNSFEPDYLTDYFQYLKDMGMRYRHWFSGHYHENKDITEKDHVLYGNIVEVLSDGIKNLKK